MRKGIWVRAHEATLARANWQGQGVMEKGTWLLKWGRVKLQEQRHIGKVHGLEVVFSDCKRLKDDF